MQGVLEECQNKETVGNIYIWWSGRLRRGKLGNPIRVKCGQSVV